MPTYSITRIGWNFENSRSVEYDADSGLMNKANWGGEDVGSVAVRINVDGNHDLVLLEDERSTDVSVLTRAVEVLTFVRDELAALTRRRRGARPVHGAWRLGPLRPPRALRRSAAPLPH